MRKGRSASRRKELRSLFNNGCKVDGQVTDPSEKKGANAKENIPDAFIETFDLSHTDSVGNKIVFCSDDCALCECSIIVKFGSIYKPNNNCYTVDRDPKTFKVIHPD